MNITSIDVINLSQRISDADAKLMKEAVAQQLALHVCPAWNVPVPQLNFVSKQAASGIIMSIEDQPDVDGALGYHTDMNNLPSGYVFVAPVLDNYGVSLYDASNPQNTSVASVLSHEVLELLIDPDACEWRDDNGTLYAYEICDACESNSYVINVGGADVSVSNFVLPDWFVVGSKGPYDYMKMLTSPFQIDAGGYAVIDRNGSQEQIFGDKFLAWKKTLKSGNFSRYTKRTTKK